MKRKINIENYEAYLLDLAEGTICDDDRAELMLFLEAHPEIDWDFEDLPELSDLEEPRLTPRFKQSLQKHEDTELSQIEHLMVASIEGVITKEESIELNTQLQQDQKLQKELGLFQKTILPVVHIEYPSKEQLLQKEARVIPFWTYAVSMAAAILALFLFNLPFDNTYKPRGVAFTEIPTADSKLDFAFEVQEDGVDEEFAEEAEKLKEQPLKSQRTIPAAKQFAHLEETSKEEVVGLNEEPDYSKNVPEAIDTLNEFVVPEEQLAEAKVPEKIDAEQVKPENSTTTKPMTPIEYVKKVIKEDVLKNKTFSESLLEEVAEVTNDKIKFEKRSKESPQFALNIGKLRISKK